VFTPTELQFLYDSVVNFAIRPEFLTNPVVEELSESIAVKLEKALADAGYVFVETDAIVCDKH